MRTLCIDIGGTRIKWAVVAHSGGTIDDWQPRVHAMRSLGWLNATLPGLLDPGNWAGIAALEGGPGPFDAVGIAITGVISGPAGRLDGWLVGRNGAPADLAARYRALIAPRPLSIRNDAVAFLRGAARHLARSRTLQPPYLLLTFGTGVGIVTGSSPDAIRVSEFEAPFRGANVARAAGRAPLEHTWDVHDLLGRRFFDWVAREQHAWSYQEVRKQFTARVVALLEDLEETYGKAGTIIVAGGNAEYVSVRQVAQRLQVPVLPLRKPELDLDPDIISLAGCIP